MVLEKERLRASGSSAFRARVKTIGERITWNILANPKKSEN
jgi:hypothetical protein